MALRVLAAAWLCAVAYAYPGYLTADSTSALAQARGDTLIDWHPPMMSVVWRACELVISGPLLMLLLQTGCFLFGVYGVARTRLAPTPAAVVASCVLLFPPVLAPMAVIWKDSQMAGYIAAGAALAVAGRPRLLVPAAFFLFMALSMRHNAAPAVVPFIVVGARSLPGLRAHWWKWSAAALGATVVLVGGAGAANRLLTEQQTYPWHNSLAVLDVAGTIRESGPMSDAEVRALLDGLVIVPDEQLQAHARRQKNVHVWWVVTEGDRRLFDAPADARARAAIARAWRRAVLEHPGGWLRHRARMWLAVMGLGGVTLAERVVHDFGDGAPPGTGVHQEVVVPYRRSGFQRAVGEALDELGRTPLFRPWLYVLVAIGLLVYTRGRGVVALFAASGLSHALGLFVAIPSVDFRYTHWTFACTVTAAAIALAARTWPRSPQDSCASGSPSASATAACTMRPSKTLTPRRRPGSRSTAARQPRPAIWST